MNRLIVISLFLIFNSFISFSQQRFAVVDITRAIIESEDGVNMQIKLKKMFDLTNRVLDKMKDDFNTQKKAFDAIKLSLNDTERQTKLSELVKLSNELKFQIEQNENEYKKVYTDLIMPINIKVTYVIQRIASQQGYSAILDKQSVPYFTPSLDITDMVISQTNNYKSEPSNSSPLSPALQKKP